MPAQTHGSTSSFIGLSSQKRTLNSSAPLIVSVRPLHAAFAVLVAVVVLFGGITYSLLSRPQPFPIPKADINVSLAAGLPYQQVTTGSWDDLYPEWSPNGNLVAYVSDRGGMWSVWVMNSNGSRARQLTTASLGAGDPSWSPDSSSIAYWRNDGPTSSIVVVSVSGGYTFTASSDLGNVVMATPKWSPDGSRLLYYRDNPTLQLMLVDLPSLTSQVLASVNGTDTSPNWAANDRVIYSSLQGGFYVTEWVNLTSGERGLLTTGDANSRGGVISPDGTRMAYYSDVTFPRQSTYSFNLSGYNVWVSSINLTEYDVWKGQIQGLHSSYLFEYVSESEHYRPGDVVTSDPLRWSADGKTLAVVFDSPLYGLGVYVWSVGTSVVMRAGPFLGVSMQPSWSPNASVVAFSCNATGNFHIWTLNTSGTGINKGQAGY
jgi:Tol biopolymer transport system component